MTTTDTAPTILRQSLLYLQVCVPAVWSDAEVQDFANATDPSGTSLGWVVRKEGNPALMGTPERVTCARRPTFVHVTLEC